MLQRSYNPLRIPLPSFFSTISFTPQSGATALEPLSELPIEGLADPMLLDQDEQQPSSASAETVRNLTTSQEGYQRILYILDHADGKVF